MALSHSSNGRSEELLRHYDAWEPVTDKRDFQWRMRLLQSLWREERGLQKGTLDGRPSGKLRGACLAMPEAQETLPNYLTRNIREVVRRELDSPGGKLYGTPRIYNNLLSSQPLCFNLFGELTLDLDLATQVLADMSDGRIARVCAIDFEFSPGRRDSRYTGDRSAFDVYVRYETRSGREGFTGIEVKYHESLSTGDEKRHYEKHGGRYDEIAGAMGCFCEARLGRLRESRLQQIWRDHLLMGMHKDVDGFEDAFFVLLHPAQNSYFSEAVQEYLECLSDDSSFRNWTLEGLVERLMDHSSAKWIRDFHRRYLDFSRLDDVPTSIDTEDAAMDSGRREGTRVAAEQLVTLEEPVVDDVSAVSSTSAAVERRVAPAYTFNPGSFSAVFDTDLGRDLWELLTKESTIKRMEDASDCGRPAVEPIQDLLLELIVQAAGGDRIKQMIGHMIRQVLEGPGSDYRLASRAIAVEGKKLFTQGARYERRSLGTNENPSPKGLDSGGHGL